MQCTLFSLAHWATVEDTCTHVWLTIGEHNAALLLRFFSIAVFAFSTFSSTHQSTRKPVNPCIHPQGLKSCLAGTHTGGSEQVCPLCRVT